MAIRSEMSIGWGAGAPPFASSHALRVRREARAARLARAGAGSASRSPPISHGSLARLRGRRARAGSPGLLGPAREHAPSGLLWEPSVPLVEDGEL